MSGSGVDNPGIRVGILAGGRGSRLGSETVEKPKPLVEIGGHPILWHIMGHCARYGLRRFAVALGYRGERVRAWVEGSPHPEWTIEPIETGLDTATGGRVKRLAPHLGGGTFMLMYGDVLSDLDLGELMAFHRSHGRLATLVAVHPRSPFGHMEMEGDAVTSFAEKPVLEEGWVNGGYFVLEPGVIDYIDGDDTMWEREPLEMLAKEGQLMAYRHPSFWQCMDTTGDREILEELWRSERALWAARA